MQNACACLKMQPLLKEQFKEVNPVNNIYIYIYITYTYIILKFLIPVVYSIFPQNKLGLHTFP